MTDFLTRALAATVVTLVTGWALMLLVGIVHHEWIAACPTLGFGWAVALASLWRVVTYPVDWKALNE